MKILITGGHGNLANSLKNYIDGDFYGKDMLDLTNFNCVSNLQNYDIIIHTARKNTKINDNLPILFSKGKKIFAFTSKQGTFMNWKKSTDINYGLEKLVLNFIAYRHNMSEHNIQLIEPGHMETNEQYDSIAKKFSEIFLSWKFEKNMIYDITQNRYIAY